MRAPKRPILEQPSKRPSRSSAPASSREGSCSSSLINNFSSSTEGGTTDLEVVWGAGCEGVLSAMISSALSSALSHVQPSGLHQAQSQPGQVSSLHGKTWGLS